MEKNIMSQRISNLVEGECKRMGRFAVAALVMLLVGGLFSPTFAQENGQQTFASAQEAANALFVAMQAPNEQAALRSEEHTSELQSLRHLVCRLLLEKKK